MAVPAMSPHPDCCCDNSDIAIGCAQDSLDLGSIGTITVGPSDCATPPPLKLYATGWTNKTICFIRPYGQCIAIDGFTLTYTVDVFNNTTCAIAVRGAVTINSYREGCLLCPSSTEFIESLASRCWINAGETKTISVTLKNTADELCSCCELNVDVGIELNLCCTGDVPVPCAPGAHTFLMPVWSQAAPGWSANCFVPAYVPVSGVSMNVCTGRRPGGPPDATHLLRISSVNNTVPSRCIMTLIRFTNIFGVCPTKLCTTLVSGGCTPCGNLIGGGPGGAKYFQCLCQPFGNIVTTDIAFWVDDFNCLPCCGSYGFTVEMAACCVDFANPGFCAAQLPPCITCNTCP